MHRSIVQLNLMKQQKKAALATYFFFMVLLAMLIYALMQYSSGSGEYPQSHSATLTSTQS